MSYLALTVGPIYKTFQRAKSTREIWGVSYFFSYFMKSIIQKVLQKDTTSYFITPYVDKEKLQIKSGVGLFHDRMILESNTFTKSDFEALVLEVLKDIDKKSAGALRYDFLKNYLQIHIVEFHKEFENALLEINDYLDSAELFYQAQLSFDNLLLEYISQKQTLKEFTKKFLVQEAFDDPNKVSFLSLPKIALNSLNFSIKEEYEDEQELMKKLIEDEAYKKSIKPYNKYIAVVQADGDNMGKVLKEIGTKEQRVKLEHFSKALFEFCLEATKMVQEFGGQMIYAGGDDLLFFAPIAKGSKNIFNLCNDISSSFEHMLQDALGDNLLAKKPTLSFGVNISYYKFPLYEARKNAASLLFEEAKKEPKNKIAYRIMKHSGQIFEDSFEKDAFFKEFLAMTALDNIDTNFLHSVYVKIERFKGVLNAIKDNEQKIRNFYQNYFNEEIHQKEFAPFLASLEEFTIKAFKAGKDINYIYATLRFKKFLLGDKQ